MDFYFLQTAGVGLMWDGILNLLFGIFHEYYTGYHHHWTVQRVIPSISYHILSLRDFIVRLVAQVHIHTSGMSWTIFESNKSTSAASSFSNNKSHSLKSSKSHSDWTLSTPSSNDHPRFVRTSSPTFNRIVRMLNDSSLKYFMSVLRRISLMMIIGLVPGTNERWKWSANQLENGMNGILLSMAALQKYPGSVERTWSLQTIISLRYFSLYGPSLSNWFKSKPFSLAQWDLIGSDILIISVESVPNLWIRRVADFFS